MPISLRPISPFSPAEDETITNCRAKLATVLAACALLSSCEAATKEGFAQLRLPKQLKEVSGLTYIGEERLLAMADERGQVYEINFATHVVKKRMAYGNPTIKGDFEGIATLDGTLYLITSDGDLYAKSLDASDTDPDYEQFETRLGKRCEIEGLTEDPTRNRLLILCKDPRKKKLKKRLTVFAWSPESEDSEEVISIKLKDSNIDKLHPSALAFAPGSQDILMVLAARELAWVEIDLEQNLRRMGRLPPGSNHLQAEGLAFDDAGRIYIADEGRSGRGTITRYDSNF